MAADLALGIAHDAPIAMRIVEIDGQHGQRALVRRAGQFREGGAADQGHVAVQHQHRVIVRYDAHGLHHGMARAQLIGLQNPLDRLLVQGRLHLRAAVPVHHIDIGGIQGARGADHMLQQRLPGQGLQHFRQVGVHPLALARCQNDDRKLHADSVGGRF